MSSSASLGETRGSPGILELSQMPASWRPAPAFEKSLSSAPWSEAESSAADYAKKKAVEEMIQFFDRKPSAVRELHDDSVEALIQVTYASTNEPEFDAQILDAARKNLTILIGSYADRERETARCREFEDLLPLAIFAHRLFPADDYLTSVITKRTNAAFRACGSLARATSNVLRRAMSVKPTERRSRGTSSRRETLNHLEDLFDLSLWSIWLTEAQLLPDIQLPEEAREFAPTAWDYLDGYPLAGADAFAGGATNEIFITTADLATHIAHIPTGVHRFPLHVSYAPELYRFHRENFYPVMQSGDFDLLASFLDTLRQYGCTPEDDRQVRDGSRLLLQVFRNNGDTWMTQRADGKMDSRLSDYDRIHRPWTAVLGLRDRKPERPQPGTYGGLVLRWLPQSK